MGTRFILPSAKKPTHALSGDTNGPYAPSVPAIGTAAEYAVADEGWG